MKRNINKKANSKFKKIVTTGVAASVLITGAGLAVRHQNNSNNNKKLPNEINTTMIEENPVIRHTVAEGDTMIGICEKYYHDSSYDLASRLARYNKIGDVNHIIIGQVIYIPTYEVVLSINAYPYDYEYDNLAKK